MKEEITDERLIALIEGETNKELEQAIQADEELKKRFNQPVEVQKAMQESFDVDIPYHVEAGFLSALEKEKSKGQQWPWMQVAASVALLVLGFIAGKFTQPNNSAELSSLMEEVQNLREVTLTSTLQRHSASERIMAVNQIEQKSSMNSELIATLISTLNTDESPNVRYAALQALKKFIADEDVRAELVKSLEAQTDPLIQISLITILVEAEEKSAIAPLKDIIENEQIAPEVKQQAEVAIQVLT